MGRPPSGLEWESRKWDWRSSAEHKRHLASWHRGLRSCVKEVLTTRRSRRGKSQILSWRLYFQVVFASSSLITSHWTPTRVIIGMTISNQTIVNSRWFWQAMVPSSGSHLTFWPPPASSTTPGSPLTNRSAGSSLAPGPAPLTWSTSKSRLKG